jgi:hypothetical protein
LAVTVLFAALLLGLLLRQKICRALLAFLLAAGITVFCITLLGASPGALHAPTPTVVDYLTTAVQVGAVGLLFTKRANAWLASSAQPRSDKG